MTELNIYVVEYAGNTTFCRAEGEGEAITFIKDWAYDGYVHEEDFKVYGPLSEDEAYDVGRKIREAWKEINEQHEHR